MKILRLIHKNYGDKLVDLIIPYLTNKKIEFVDKSTIGKVLTIGSLLNHPNILQENDIIWGSGLTQFTRIKAPESVKIIALRGPITAGLIDSPEMKNFNNVYGDPALLLPEIVDAPKTKKHLGIMPHLTEIDLIKEQYADNGLFINVYDSVESVIEKICSCHTLITSSLHGLITAEAYGVQCIWVKTEDRVYFRNRMKLKFNDYLIATKRTSYEPITWEQAINDKQLQILEPMIIDLTALKKSWQEVERCYEENQKK